MQFRIRNPIENGPIQKDKHRTFKERFPRAIRRSILAGALSVAGLTGYTYEKRHGGKDYTNAGTFNEAFNKARGNKEKYFYWKEKRFTTDLVDKEFSDNYWESKKFLE